MLKTLLNHIGAELVGAEMKYSLFHLVDDKQLVVVISVLQYMRYYVVSVLVLRQVQHPFRDFIKNGSDLGFFAVLQHSLNDPAAVLMNAHFIYSVLEWVHYELHLVTCNLLNDLLYDMVAILIFYTVVDLVSNLEH